MFTVPPQLIPDPATLANYIRLFSYIPFWRQLFNTVLICVTIVAGQLLFSSMGAYAFGRLQFPGRDTLFLVYLGTMMIPSQVTLIPSYVLIRLLGWVNTYAALVGPVFLGSAFATFFLRQFIMTIPSELEDAAHIDGAGYFRIFGTIILPLIRPALATIAVFATVAFWNDFLWPLVVINSEDMRPLTVGIALLSRSYYGTDWPVLMAGVALSVLPLLAIFFAAQREFVGGIVMGALKG